MHAYIRTCMITLHHLTLHYAMLHYITLHCAALRCTALHCIALHCTALHCIALHYITYMHKYIHTGEYPLGYSVEDPPGVTPRGAPGGTLGIPSGVPWGGPGRTPQDPLGCTYWDTLPGRYPSPPPLPGGGYAPGLLEGVPPRMYPQGYPGGTPSVIPVIRVWNASICIKFVLKFIEAGHLNMTYISMCQSHVKCCWSLSW